MKIRNILIGLASILLLGCYHISFVNDRINPSNDSYEQWHHNTLLSLVEVSDPVALKDICSSRNWSMVTTQETFGTGILPGLANAALTSVLAAAKSPVMISVGFVWDPSFVKVYCAQQ